MSTFTLSDQYSKKILNSLTEGVYIIDKEFKIIFVNNSAVQIIGIKPEDVLGKVCRTFCKSERCLIGCPITEVLRTGESIIDLESSLQNNKGNTIPVKLNASVLRDEDNKPIGGIISFRKDTVVNFDEYLKGQNHFYGIVGKSKVMRTLFKEIQEISRSEANVLITGETGVGKELVADAIKNTSLRNDKIFIKVNCAALPDTLLASELFGHVKGAFTDAIKDRAGRFEHANGGTIYLDEVTEIPIHMQSRLLRIIQHGTFERLGESIQRKVNVRIIASTNKPIQEEVAAGRFREDLFYRLNVIPLHIPPLRERKEDIIFLVDAFIKKYANKYNKKIETADSETMEVLYNYNWPGNVRELENAIEYAFIRSKREDYLCSCCLPPTIRDRKKCDKKLSIKEIEKDEKTETLLALLRQNKWNKTRVAKILGINRSTVHRIINKKSSQQ
jgi:PAS domain S-box-containing protein